MGVPYDSFDYPKYWQKRTYEDQCEKIALKNLLKKIKPEGKVIDIGGGFGRLVPTYASFFQDCLVIDPSQKLLRIGKDYWKNIKNVSFQKGSLPKIDLKDNFCNAVLLVRVIHHLKNPLPSLKEISRILQPKGFLILEMANKVHFRARIKAFFSGDFSLTKDLTPLERRSSESISSRKILFLNHHPKKIISDLEQTGFIIKEILSVSNFRHPLIKKLIPDSILLCLEKLCQKPLAKVFFGPSIFILAQKS